jgi:hypothetical protein
MSVECIESGEKGWRMAGECIESGQKWPFWRVLEFAKLANFRRVLEFDKFAGEWPLLKINLNQIHFKNEYLGKPIGPA